MANSTPRPSSPRLSEYARKFVFPPGIVKTVWPRVEAKGREVGLGFDWWQSQLGTVCLGYGVDGKYVATIGGVGMSIPRQVGKTYFVLALLVIMCILFPGLQVVWTAHHLRTSTKTFTSLRGICRRKKVAPHVKAMRAANGEQQVEFHNGSTIMFGARSMGFGRGFDEIDVEVYDEAQILDAKALEDMVAATNQSRHVHGALLFYMGTPPKPADPSGAFTERRTEAWTGTAEHSIWLEIGADPASDPNDPAQWPKMNPSFPLRTPIESMLRLRKNLKDEDSWNREGRGIWDDDGLLTAIPLTKWAERADRSPEPAPHVGKVWLGVDTTPERSRTTIVAAGLRADDVPMVEITRSADGSFDNRPGVDWALDRLVGMVARNDVAAVVIDRRSAAASLIQPLLDAGVPVETTDAAGFGRSWGQFYGAAVETGRLWHLAQPELDAAVKAAGLRMLGEQVVPDRKRTADDISPLIGAQLAHYGLVNGLGLVKNAGKGRVVVLT